LEYGELSINYAAGHETIAIKNDNDEVVAFTPGKQGPQGPQGEQGNVGAQGPQGADGTNGEEGKQGPQGVEGVQGPQGPQGDRGFQGPKATTEEVVEALSGTNYFNGVEYVSSAETIIFTNNGVEKGRIDASDFVIDGMVDDAYISGTNLVIVFNNDASGKTIEVPIEDIFNPNNYYTKDEIDARDEVVSGALTDLDDRLDVVENTYVTGATMSSTAQTPYVTNNILTIPTVAGTQGPQGPQGTNGTNGKQGPQGPQGADGTNGTDGKQGPQGADGTNGTDGKQGPQGPQGADGTNGTDGKQGPQGPQGADGTNGTDGKQGPQGANGTNGTDGKQGPQGANGSNGTNGTDGKQGPQGPQGADGTNGTNGTDGKQGPQGPEGPSTIPTIGPGDEGKVLKVVNGVWALVTPINVYSGSGTPPASVGIDGDLYLQTS
jgi:hypothetical protein